MSKEKNNLVYKSNAIINASYALSVAEQRILLACIGRIYSDDDKSISDKHTLTVDEAQDLFYTNKDRRNAYRDLTRASEKLFDRKIIIYEKNARGEKIEVLTRWVSTIKLNETAMEVTLHFHDEIKPYLSQLKDNFTKYRLKHIAELKSSYAIRIYEMIVSWSGQNKSFVEISVDDFRTALQLGRKYPLFGHLKSKVIAPSVEQINEYTNFELDIKARKKGRERSYSMIQFRFNQKTVDVENEQQIFDKNIEKRRKAKDKEALKQANEEKQRQVADYKKFAENCVIEPSMIFYSQTLGKNLSVDDDCLIQDKDVKKIDTVSTYFLDGDMIKKLIFMKELKQVIEGKDKNTFDIFNETN